jgi:hypothetical protein
MPPWLRESRRGSASQPQSAQDGMLRHQLGCDEVMAQTVLMARNTHDVLAAVKAPGGAEPLSTISNLAAARLPSKSTLSKLTQDHSICASLPSQHSSALSIRSQIQQAPSSDRALQTHSAAQSTAPHSAQLSTDLCQTFPSWVRFSDLPVCRTTQTTLYRSPRASGKHSYHLVRLPSSTPPARMMLTWPRAIPSSPQKRHRVCRL